MSELPPQPNDEIRSLHYRQWHPVEALHTTGTDDTIPMLYFKCRGGKYFRGSLARR